MAHVAKCPQCEHDLLVPDDAAAGGLAKCPACKSFFELSHAETRELPMVTLMDAPADAPPVKPSPSVTITPTVAPTPIASSQAPEPEEEAFNLDDEPLELVERSEESVEEAAERIDQWFRSAKTLSDVPATAADSEDADVDYELMSPETPAEPVSAAPAGGKTIDISDLQSAGGFDSEFELDQPAEESRDTAAWEDSQDMERLLAGIESQPAGSLAAFDRKPAPPVHEEQAEYVEAADEWSPDASIAIRPGVGEPQKKRSIVRTLVGTVVGGVLGLALAYYALLWIKGPSIDVLELAKYLPKSALPASFDPDAKKSAVSPPSSMISDLAASDKVGEPAPDTTEPPAEPAADKAADKPAEKQAAFTTPVEPPKAATASDDRYAVPATKTETLAPPTHEPAPLDAPPAKEIAPAPPASEPVKIANAPSFTMDELTASLQAAKDARPALVAGNFSDGSEVKRAKGASYAAMADLAQKDLFVDATVPAAEIENLNPQIEKLFRQTLLDSHTRDEVAQIAPLWIASPNRKHGGVFFAGSLSHHDPKGTVVECSIELAGGKSIVTLVPAAALQAVAGSSRPVGVVGYIIDKPAERVQGYTGSAQQAVFAKQLISLE